MFLFDDLVAFMKSKKFNIFDVESDESGGDFYIPLKLDINGSEIVAGVLVSYDIAKKEIPFISLHIDQFVIDGERTFLDTLSISNASSIGYKIKELNERCIEIAEFSIDGHLSIKRTFSIVNGMSEKIAANKIISFLDVAKETLPGLIILIKK